MGAILAIVSGFVVAFYQRSEERNDASLEALAIVQACYLLGFQALETVGERLENILTPSGIKFSLQGDRTSEMVEAMREFDTSRVPAEILKNFILLRSHVFAINKRISEIYDSKVDRNGDKNTSRHDRLESTVVTYRKALEIFGTLSESAMGRGVLADAEGIKDALVELGNLFSVDELRRLRTRQSYKSETGRKLFWIAKELSDRLVDHHPAQLHRPSRKARPNAFLYRYAMVCTLYLMDWLRDGAMPKKADRFRNDLVDLNFATYGTYFNGVMTEDAKLTRYHGELRYVLGLLGARVPPEYLDVLAAELANPGGESDHIRFRL